MNSQIDDFDAYVEQRENIRQHYIDTIIPELDRIHEYNSSCKDGDCKNVLIIERPEYGAHNVVEQWLTQNKVEAVHYRAETNPDIMRMRCGNMTSEFLFASNELDRFDQEGKVLIIENYDMTGHEARKHLNLLVIDRLAKDPSMAWGRKLEKLWYIIATAYTEGRYGYDPLSEETMDCFNFVIRLDK